MLQEQTKRILADRTAAQGFARNAEKILKSRKYRGVINPARQLTILDELDKDPTAEGLEGLADRHPDLEKVVALVGRPALLIQNDTFEVPTSDEWSLALNAARKALEHAIRATGRVEIDRRHTGTCWMVGPDVVVTNRHVAQEFARPEGPGFVIRRQPFSGPMDVRVDFREEFDQDDPALEFQVIEVLYMSPDADNQPDIALLRLDPGSRKLPAPIAISEAAPAMAMPVAVLGYPAFDPDERDPVVVNDIFQGIFDVKRLAPGRVMTVPQIPGWLFEHDCSTLGGNSGSVVLDLGTGAAVGLHFAGTSRRANRAVHASELVKLLNERNVHRTVPVIEMEHGDDVVDEKPAKPEDYVDRKGYKPGFLGDGDAKKAPLPTPGAALQPNLAPVTGDGHVLKYKHFSVVMNAARRLPLITAVNIDGNQLRRVPGGRTWKMDPRIELSAQVGNELYRENDLDKGHMVRRLDPVWGTLEEARQANADTHHYTNACPQDHTFNDEVWGDLEDFILDSAANEDPKLNVLTGPVLASDDPVYRHIQIPREFWKVVSWLDHGQHRSAAFILTQVEHLGDLEFNPNRFGTVQVSFAELEQKTDLDFGRLREVGVEIIVDEGRRRTLDRVEQIRLK